MCTTKLIAAAVAACLLAAGSARATLSSIDDPLFGPGSITRDTATGLEWLDVPRSANRTFAEVLAQFGPGGDFRGMRHATGAEITRLSTDAEIPVIGNITTGGQELNYPIAQSLIALVGATGFQGTFPETLGFFDATPPGATADLDFFFSNMTPAYLASVDGAFRNPTLHWPQIGHWLVREVPEPSSWVLLGVGLFALIWRCSRRARWRDGVGPRHRIDLVTQKRFSPLFSALSDTFSTAKRWLEARGPIHPPHSRHAEIFPSSLRSGAHAVGGVVGRCPYCTFTSKLRGASGTLFTSK